MTSWGRRPTPRHVRLAVLERDQWRCQLGYPGCTYHAVEVDHIESTAQTGVSREQVDVDGCQSACASCHAVKSKAEAAAGRRASKRPPGSTTQAAEAEQASGRLVDTDSRRPRVSFQVVAWSSPTTAERPTAVAMGRSEFSLGSRLDALRCGRRRSLQD